jgi:cytochrome c553
MYRACLAVDVEQMPGADAGTAQCVVRHGQGKAVVAIGGQEAGMAGWSCVEQLSDFEIVRNQNNQQATWLRACFSCHAMDARSRVPIGSTRFVMRAQISLLEQALAGYPHGLTPFSSFAAQEPCMTKQQLIAILSEKPVAAKSMSCVSWTRWSRPFVKSWSMAVS